MPGYVDGFVLAVPKKKIPAYRLLSKRAGHIWKELGAVEYKECVGDDIHAKGALTFPRAVKLKRGETVFFSWIVYKSRAQRDRVNARVMKDPRIASMMKDMPMPFDPKRMLYSGFKFVVDM